MNSQILFQRFFQGAAFCCCSEEKLLLAWCSSAKAHIARNIHNEVYNSRKQFRLQISPTLSGEKSAAFLHRKHSTARRIRMIFHHKVQVSTFQDWFYIQRAQLHIFQSTNLMQVETNLFAGPCLGPAASFGWPWGLPYLAQQSRGPLDRRTTWKACSPYAKKFGDL